MSEYNNGLISISQTTSTEPPYSWITITLKHNDSVSRIELSNEEFSKAVTGIGHRQCKVTKIREGEN